MSQELVFGMMITGIALMLLVGIKLYRDGWRKRPARMQAWVVEARERIHQHFEAAVWFTETERELAFLLKNAPQEHVPTLLEMIRMGQGLVRAARKEAHRLGYYEQVENFEESIAKPKEEVPAAPPEVDDLLANLEPEAPRAEAVPAAPARPEPATEWVNGHFVPKRPQQLALVPTKTRVVQ